MKPIRFSLAAALLAALAAPAAAQFTLLGAGTTAYDVSGDGSKVVGYRGGTNFVWTAANGLQIIGGTAPSVAGGHPSISQDGNTVVASAVNTAGENEMAGYSFATGQWTTLGNLGASSGSDTSSGWGVSADGSTAVGLGWISAGSAHAITAKGGVITDLGSTVDGMSSRANAVNADGSVVVGWQDAEDGFRQGAVWRNGVQTILKDSNDNVLQEVGAVSDDGNWITGTGNGNEGREFWRWSEATGYQSLGNALSGADTSTAFTAMTGDAKTMIGYSRGFGPAGFGKGVIWTASLGVVNLNTYAASLGINTGGVTLALPLGISADGRTIVGLGSNNQSWVLTLPQAVPEPGTWVALGLGALAMARRRRQAR